MSTEHKYESGSLGEELFVGVPAIEEKGKIVEKAVNEGYFSLDQALAVYKLSFSEFVGYFFIRHAAKFNNLAKPELISKIVSELVRMQFSSTAMQTKAFGEMIKSVRSYTSELVQQSEE